MMEWKKVKISDCLSYIVDNRGKTPKELSTHGHPLLEINVVSSTQKYPLYLETKKYVDDRVYANWFRSGHPQEGDILIPTVGTLGAVSYVNRNDCCIAQNLIALRTDGTRCDSEFLYYQLCNPDTRKRLLNLDIGAVQASIKVPHLKSLELSLPPLPTQRRIAAILSSLDAQIENNNRINRNLEAQAQALFKSWFVDFEPWGGAMPEGWREGKLGDLSDKLASGGTPNSMNSSYYEGDIKWYSTKELKDGFLIDSEKHISQEAYDDSATKMFPADTILMAIYAAPTVGRLGILTKEACFNQAAVGIYPKKEIGFPFVYSLLLSERTNLNNLACGAAQQNLNVGLVKNYTIFIPSLDVLERYNKLVIPLFDQIRNNTEANARLASLRDTLLPKLMKGEIEV